MKKSNDKAFNVAVYHSWTKTGDDMDKNNENGTNEDERNNNARKNGFIITILIKILLLFTNWKRRWKPELRIMGGGIGREYYLAKKYLHTLGQSSFIDQIELITQTQITQYFVWPPWAAITATIRRGILS